MPAQGTALGIGSRVENSVENSNALKGQNWFVVKNLVSPFQGWADFHSDQIPRADPASGVPPAWAFLFRPLRGGRKRNTRKLLGSTIGTRHGASPRPVRKSYFIGWFWKNSHMRSLAEISRVLFPRNRKRGSRPGQV